MKYQESKSLELKRGIPQKNQIIKTCVAFANGSGGELIIGVDDNSKKIIGITEADRNRVFEEISNSIYDSISPTVIPEVFEKNINEKNIITIKIYAGSRPPYFIKSEGNKKGVYLRIGATTKRASEEYIQELYRQQKNQKFDEEASLAVYKKNKQVQDIYGRNLKPEKLLMEKVVCRSEQSPQKLYYTNAGTLFFIDNPHDYISEAVVICTLFKGKEGRKIIQTFEFQGPIPDQVEKTLNQLQIWIRQGYEVTKSGKLEAEQKIPMLALREAIINAVIHRKYFIPGAVKVAVYENRIEVFSPGSFPGMIGVENIGDGTTFLRNPTVAKLARRHKLVEKLGSGVKLIFDSCKKAKLKKPKYVEGGDFVKLTLYSDISIEDNVDDNEELFLFIEQNKKVTVKEVLQKFNFSRNTATRKLNKLIDKKKIKRTGKGPGTYYELV